MSETQSTKNIDDALITEVVDSCMGHLSEDQVADMRDEVVNRATQSLWAEVTNDVSDLVDLDALGEAVAHAARERLSEALTQIILTAPNETSG